MNKLIGSRVLFDTKYAGKPCKFLGEVLETRFFGPECFLFVMGMSNEDEELRLTVVSHRRVTLEPSGCLSWQSLDGSVIEGTSAPDANNNVPGKPEVDSYGLVSIEEIPVLYDESLDERVDR